MSIVLIKPAAIEREGKFIAWVEADRMMNLSTLCLAGYDDDEEDDHPYYDDLEEDDDDEDDDFYDDDDDLDDEEDEEFDDAEYEEDRALSEEGVDRCDSPVRSGC